jgi:light-regulated signal transduction histidine kinase (bacteriophytochrome)
MQTATRPAATSPELEELAHAVCHDLAQPLTTIAGFARLIISRYDIELDDQAREYLEFIAEGTVDMQETIDGLVATLRGG